MKTPEQRYLELLKKALSYELWPDTLVPVSWHRSRRMKIEQYILAAADACFGLRGLRLFDTKGKAVGEKRDAKIWPAHADTMLSPERIDQLQQAVETVLQESVPGDLIEAGVWRGGACILMRAILAVYDDPKRKVFVADSFQGCPEPDAERWPADQGDKHSRYKELAVSQQQVEDNFRKYDLLDDRVVFLPGWFKDTLPTAPIEQLAILRLDGDMYDSTINTLEHLYPKLSRGGFCIVDDYGLPGCKQAVTDYREANGITEAIETIDWTGVYWRKA